MSQRNPMNERYISDKHQGKTRKSAASAKPKKAQAGTVVRTTAKKTPKERKAEEKQRRREESERQREIDRKYYKPDTERYKQLRRLWVIALVAAVVCVALSWILRGVGPEWIAIAFLIGAYGFIIWAFYIDFSKIRKERRAYQTRMIAQELEQEKAERAARSQQGKAKGSKSGTAKGRRPQADDGAADASPDEQESVPERKRFSLFSRKGAAANGGADDGDASKAEADKTEAKAAGKDGKQDEDSQE